MHRRLGLIGITAGLLLSACGDEADGASTESPALAPDAPRAGAGSGGGSAPGAGCEGSACGGGADPGDASPSAVDRPEHPVIGCAVQVPGTDRIGDDLEDGGEESR